MVTKEDVEKAMAGGSHLLRPLLTALVTDMDALRAENAELKDRVHEIEHQNTLRNSPDYGS